jgi:hypothetical protein
MEVGKEGGKEGGKGGGKEGQEGLTTRSKRESKPCKEKLGGLFLGLVLGLWALTLQRT